MKKRIVNFYFINIPDKFQKALKASDSFYTKSVYEPRLIFDKTADIDTLKEADYVIANLSYQESLTLVADYSKYRKSIVCHIVLIARPLELTDLIEALPEADDIVDDVWRTGMTVKEFLFHYKKWVQTRDTFGGLDESNLIYKEIIAASSDLIWHKSVDGKYLDFNDAFVNALPPSRIDGHKKTREECLNQSHNFIWEIAPNSSDEYINDLMSDDVFKRTDAEVIHAGHPMAFDEEIIVNNKSLKHLYTIKAPIYGRNGILLGTAGIAKDVTESRLYNRMLEQTASEDYLTGLMNRRALYIYMDQNSYKDMVIYYIDIDHFKQINDRYGHDIGDAALRYIADMLTQILPEYKICRIGGNGFIAVRVINHSSYEEKINDERMYIRDELVRVLGKDERFRTLSASIGRSYKDAKFRNFEIFISEADKDMYEDRNRRLK